jgi:hypothetical protein
VERLTSRAAESVHGGLRKDGKTARREAHGVQSKKGERDWQWGHAGDDGKFMTEGVRCRVVRVWIWAGGANAGVTESKLRTRADLAGLT